MKLLRVFENVQSINAQISCRFFNSTSQFEM